MIKYINNKFVFVKLRNVSLSILGLVLLSFIMPVWPVMVLVIFCIGNSLLLSIDRYVDANHDLELSTFSAVLFSVKYGLMWGIAAAILTKIAEILYNKNLAPDDVLGVIAFIVAACLGYIFRSVDIAILGACITVAINILNVILSKNISGLSFIEIISQTITNLFLNLLLFLSFSRFVIGII